VVVTGTAPFTYTLPVSDANGDTLSYTLLDAAAGMTVTAGGLFTWQPPEVGFDVVYTPTIIVSDGVLTDSELLYLVVVDSNDPPFFTTVISDQTLVEGTTVTFTVPISDVDLPPQPLSLTMRNQPDGAVLDDNHFTWPTTEADDGVFTVTLIVSDGSLTASQTVAITVTEQNEAPVLADITDQTVGEGGIITFTAVVTDSDIPTQTLTFSLSNAPVGATVSNRGVFIWATTEADDGIYTPTLAVSDGIVTTTQIVTLTVTEQNRPPRLATLSDQTVSEGTVITFTAVATDDDLPAQPLQYSLAEAPFGSIISDTGGGFSWPTNDTHGGGVYTVTVLVSDGALTDSQTVVITVTEVNEPPAFAATLVGRTIAEGDTLSVNAVASDPDVPAQPLIYTLANEPTGMSINNLGRITWKTDEQDGPATFDNIVVNVSDGVVTTTQTVAITVTEVNTAPLMAPLSDITVAEGALITFATTVTDTDVPAQPLTYTLQSDTPISATLNQSGLFSWTTTEADGGELYRLTLRVSDGVVTSSQSLLITVTEANNAPVLAPLADRTVGERSLVGFTAVATDTDNPAQSLSFSLDNAPAGASIGPSSGEFTWLTTEDDGFGVYSATVRVSDGAITTSQTVAITVTEVNDPPLITPVAPQRITETFELSFTVTCHG
jgi:hypothetical protein